MAQLQPQSSNVALVTGANGISGAYLVRQMSNEPYWAKIIATSRRPPHGLPNSDRVQFAQADLSGDAASISKAFKDAGVVGVTHFFHMAYLG